MGKRASIWFLRLLENRLRLTLVMWQVIFSLLIVLHIDGFKGGLIVATHYQALPSIRRLHHIRGFVRSVVGNDVDPALE